MSRTTPQTTKERTNKFIHALADSGIDAVNISAEQTGAGATVHAWINPDDLDDAEGIANDHGFTLYGETLTQLKAKHNPHAADGRDRYRFETHHE